MAGSSDATVQKIRIASAFIALIAGIVAAGIATWLLYIQPFLHITPPFSQWFDEHRCIMDRFCDPPVWVDQPLGAALVVASILCFALGLFLLGYSSPGKEEVHEETNNTPFIVMLRLAFGGLCAAAILFQAYQTIVKEQTPSGAVWLLGIISALALAISLEAPAIQGGLGKAIYALVTGLGIVVTVVAVAIIQSGAISLGIGGFLLVAGLLIFGIGASGCAKWSERLPWKYSISLLLLTLLMLELGMLRAWSWKFAFIGDEWAFYEMGLFSIHDLKPWLWFEIRGYNGYFAAMSSQYIGWCMQLFGDTVYGWRLASLLPMVISLPAVYAIGEWLYGKRAGLIAAGLFAVQHPLLQFAMVPYNNTQSVAVIVVSLGLLVLALKRNSSVLYLLTGLVTGFGFIVYASARLVIVMISVLLLFHAWNNWRRFVTSTLFVAVGGLASAAPMLFNLTNWQSLLKATPLQSEVAGEQLSIVDQIAHNVFSGLLAFSFNPTNTHYVIGPYADPLTMLLMLAGIGFMLISLLRERRFLSWFVASLLFIVMISGIQQYGRIVTTRVFVLSFYFAIFAGVGATVLLGLRQRQQRLQGTLLPILLITLVGFLNQWHIERVAMPEIPTSPQSLLIQQAQQMAATQDEQFALYVIWPDANRKLINQMLRAYAVNSGQVAFLSPKELLTSETICQSPERAQMVLLNINSADYNESIRYLGDCWQTASQEQLVDQASFPQFTRFVTASAQQELARVASSSHNLQTKNWRYPLRKVERIEIDASNTLFGLSRSQDKLYRLDLNTEKLQQFDLVQHDARDMAMTPDGLLLVAAPDKKLVWYDGDGAPVRILPPDDQVGVLHSLAVAQNGDIYAADLDHFRIVQFSQKGEVVRFLTGEEQLGQPSMLALSADESSLWSLDTLAGRLYQIALADDHVLAEFSAPSSHIDLVGELAVTQQNTLLTLAPDAGQLYELQNNGSVVAAFGSFLQPMGFAADSQGDLIVSDWTADELVRLHVAKDRLPRPTISIRIAAESERLLVSPLEPESPLVVPVTVPEGAGIMPDRYTYYTREQLSDLVRAQMLVIGPAGTIYVLDGAGRRIYLLDSEGNVLSHIDEADAPFQELSDLDVDAQGNLYVLDARRSSISVFDANGTFIRSLIQAQGKLGSARGFAVDSNGSIWVAATSLGRILVLNGDGAEQRSIQLAVDGSSQPVDVMPLSNGTMFVAEGSKGEILLVSDAGELLNRRPVPNFNTVESAHFASDNSGNFYVTNPESGEVTLLDAQGDAQQEWYFMLDSERRTKVIGADIDAQGEIWATDYINGGVIRYKP